MGTQNYAPQNGAPPSAPASGIFKPRVGFPEIVALAFDQGKMVTSHLDGSSQVLLTFTDGRRWYVSIFTANRIHEAGILARQQFEVTKLGRGINDWQIVPLSAQPGAAPGTVPFAPVSAGPATQSNTSTCDGNGRALPPQALAPRPAAPPAPDQRSQTISPASAKLMACLKSAIDAAKEAEVYAKAQDFELRFSSEDVRTMANTLAMNGGAR